MLSFVNFSFSQTTIYLETDECVAENNLGAISSISLNYTDLGTAGLDSSDTIDTASSDSSIDFIRGATIYYY